MSTASKFGKSLILALVTLLVVAGLGTAALNLGRASYTIVEGDNRVEVTTWKGSVADILSAAEVKVSEYDLVTPALDQQVADGTQIKITRATAYRVLVGSDKKEIFSTEGNFQNILTNANFRHVSLPLQRNSQMPLLAQAGKLTIADGGKETQVELAAGDTLANALEKAQVKLSAIDELALTSADGKLSLDIIRVIRGQVSEEEEVPFETQVRETANLYEGQERIVSEGAKGTTKITYYRHIRGGKKLVEKELSRETAVAAQPRIIEKGTLERPRENSPAATRAETRNSSTPPTPAPASATVPGDVWAALAQCESGGNPTTNTGNGYYGMYQFSLPTWRAVGGQGLPSEASAEEQTYRAQILQARAGWGQWPACARKLGLL
ncbi:MAG: transglycosylase family protein [Actinomycetaceae bacterium]|nr:transglycosylase family protein [Actinomycetaceae bacterium]